MMSQSQILIAGMSEANGDVTPICVAASNWNKMLWESLHSTERQIIAPYLDTYISTISVKHIANHYL